jgi:hypothetical protein
MAKRSPDIDLERYAILGAQQRLKEIKQEEFLIRAWLRARTTRNVKFGDAGSDTEERTRRSFGKGLREKKAARNRKRRKLTPEEKKAIGERMRRYWAERRKQRAKR